MLFPQGLPNILGILDPDLIIAFRQTKAKTKIILILHFKFLWIQDPNTTRFDMIGILFFAHKLFTFRNNGFPGISFLLQNIGRPQSSPMDVSVPTLLVNLTQEHSSTQESLPPAFKDLDDLEDLEYQQEENIQDLSIQHAQQTKRANGYANTLEKMHENQKKEMRDLEQRHRQDRLKAISEMKAQHPTLECPICLEDMAPPTQIFQCQSGHLVCGTCHPRLSTCSCCKRKFMGRAIGMEQFIRSLHKLE